MEALIKISADRIKAISSGNSILVNEYASISHFIKTNCLEIYHDILARPSIVGGYCLFYPVKYRNCRSIEYFSINTKKGILDTYFHTIQYFRSKAQELIDSDTLEKQKWGEILNSIFTPKNNYIFSDGNHIVLVWGFEFNDDSDYSDIRGTEVQEVSASFNDNNYDSDDLDLTDLKEEVEKNTTLVETRHTNYRNNTIQNTKGTGKKIWVKSQKPNRLNWFNVFISGIGTFFRRSWILLLLLVIILILLKFSGCCNCIPWRYTGDTSLLDASLLREILPSQPRQRTPIDTSALVYDDSTYGRIAADRINIALQDKNVSFNRFIIDLHDKFMSPDDKIIYYDPETYRLQLKVDPQKRNSIKTEVKRVMSEYSLLVWDESIFMTSAYFNDPVLYDAQQSWYYYVIDVESAWTKTRGDRSVIIAIIDDGFDLQHPELQCNLKLPYNVHSQDKKVFANNNKYHGTHVAGIALAVQNNNNGGAGIASGCSFMPIQLTSEDEILSTTDVIDGILYAIKNDAAVINLSLGKQFSPQITSLTPRDQEAILVNSGKDEAEFWQELFDYAAKENTAVVMAAGNQNILIGVDPMTRSDNVIVVSAIDNQLAKGSFSNYGKRSTVSAPGLSIYSTLPNNGYGYLDGTSMAAPMVAGAVGLMKSVNRNLSTASIIKILKETAKSNSNTEIGPILQIGAAVIKAKGI